MDFHTHNLNAPPGSAIVNLPVEALLAPDSFRVVPGGLYSAGIHPWWTTTDLRQLWEGFLSWLDHPQVVAVGECGLDKLQGADMGLQEQVFIRQLAMAEERQLPVTVHCVKAYDRLLALKKSLHPSVQWTVHGFRGKPELARQLLSAGLDLSFGRRRNAESWALTPVNRRHEETDDDFADLSCGD